MMAPDSAISLREVLLQNSGSADMLTGIGMSEVGPLLRFERVRYARPLCLRLLPTTKSPETTKSAMSRHRHACGCASGELQQTPNSGAGSETGATAYFR